MASNFDAAGALQLRSGQCHGSTAREAGPTCSGSPDASHFDLRAQGIPLMRLPVFRLPTAIRWYEGWGYLRLAFTSVRPVTKKNLPR